MIRLALACFTFGLLAGCGPADPLEPHPVNGTLVINGEPAEGCIVTFIPLDASMRGKVMSGGITDAEGKFTLTTKETGDGAPAGEFGVTLRWEAKKWKGMEEEILMDPVDPIGPDLLMERYSSPEKSPLKATVTEGTNNLEPFVLEKVKLLKGAE